MTAISRKTIIIAGIAAVIAVILLGGIGIGVLVSLRKNHPSPGIFKRCDRSGEPMGEIKISSCPDSSSVGYCQIKSDEPTILEFTFSAGIDYNNAVFNAQGPVDQWNSNLPACGYGMRCPGSGGTTQTLRQVVPSRSFKKGRTAKVSFSIYDHYINPNYMIFCVEFPAKIV